MRSHHLALGAMLACCCATAKEPVRDSTAIGGLASRIRFVAAAEPQTIGLEPGRQYVVREMEFPRASDGSQKDLRLFTFVPKDEQSSATLGIGAGGHRKTEQTIAQHYQGATVTKVAGSVSGTTVDWWRYRDSHHLYSTCYTSLRDRNGTEHPVYIDLVANSPERLASLEAAFSRIELY